MRLYFKLFKDNYLLNKQEIINSLEKFIEHFEASKDVNSYCSITRRNSILELLHKFKYELEKTKIPKIADQWYFYDYILYSHGIKLVMSFCDEIQFDEYGEPTSMDCTELFELINVESEYLSIKDFASLYGVKEQTAKKWIADGRIRCAKLNQNNWVVSKIAERPKRKFESADYWINRIINNEQFKFLEKSSRIYIYQNDENEGLYNINLYDSKNKYIKTVELNKRQRANLEYLLLSSPDVKCASSDDCIQYIPSKDKCHDKRISCELVENKDAKNTNEEDSLEYGPVIIIKGVHKGRIGYYDDDEYPNCIVYWGDIYLCRDHYDLIKYNYLSNSIPTLSLVNRIDKLHSEIALLRIEGNDYYLCTQLLSELLYANEILTERYINTRFLQKEKNMKVFISHASKDLQFARCLATDIMGNGYDVFLDDWSIDLGENIIGRINEGLEESKILIPIISQNFLESVFCMDEWTSFYMRFAKIKKQSIIPLVIDNSEVPSIMSAIKYFRMLDDSTYPSFIFQLMKRLKKY